jgi:HEAT repeat protein
VKRLAVVILGVVLLAPGVRAADLFDDVEQLANDLKGVDVGKRREAVEKLDAYSSRQAAPLLLGALTDADLDVRVRATLALGRHRVAQAQPRLLGQLNDPEPRLRAASAAALAQLPTEAPGHLVKALERTLSDGEHEVREAAIEALGRLPAEAVRSELVPIAARLDDENVSVREQAALLLGQLGSKRAVIPLLGRLADGSREVRRAAVDALAQLGDEKAAPAVLRLVGDDQPEEVRAQAIVALGRLHARAAVPTLIRLVERGAESLRGRAAFALGRIAQAAPVGDDPAISVLVAALGRDETRTAAREALAQVGAAAVPALIDRIAGSSGEELQGLVQLLGELGDARATPALLGELERGRIGRERVIDALGAIAHGPSGDRTPIAELVALLEGGDATVRRHAMAALAGVIDARAAQSLAQASADPDASVRLGAIAELGRLKTASAVPLLLRALESRDERTQAAAARALGEIGDGRALDPLIAAVEHGPPRARRDAADALPRIPNASRALPALLRLARSGSAERRPEALAALGGVLRGKPDAGARELLLSLVVADDPVGATEAIDALAATRDHAAWARLERLIGKSTLDPGLRRRLVAAGAELGAPARTLAARLDDDSDARVRAEAAWALGKRGSEAVSYVPALERALSAPFAALRANAAAALARLGKQPAALERLVDDPDPAVRANAALALRGKKSLLERLRADESPLVRAAAAHALEARTGPAVGGDFIAAHLTDFDGAPLGDAAYWLVLPDGLVKSGFADARGTAREESVPTGSCRLEFPDGAGR